MRLITALRLATATGTLWAGAAWSGAVTCLPSDQRVATLDDAVECRTVISTNLNSSDDINALFGTSYSWSNQGELTGAGTNLRLTVQTDSWGTDVTGTWEIDESFWQTYSRAVITMHVGHGGGNPDAFAWLITPGETSGNFTYERIAGTGGGLSNLFLFGSGPALRSGDPTPMPEPGTAALIGLGLVASWAARRRTTR